MNLDRDTLCLFGGLFVLLTVATAIGYYLRTTVQTDGGRKVVENLVSRTRAWWSMCLVFGGALVIGGLAPVIMFALVSFVALREFVTLTPTRRGDHRPLFWAFFVILPLHYWTLAIEWYQLFVILIPVYAFLFIPMRAAMAGDTERFLERTSKVQWGLMVCVYFTSYAPALLMLEIPGYSAGNLAQNAKLLFFLVFVTQISDVLQYVWGKLCGKRPIAPKVSPSKTVEGFVGGSLSAVAAGAGLWWITPFHPWQAAGMSAAIVLMGFFGGLVMSAIKRDRGVKDYGELIPGHGGMMDRIDSLCFAAPVFFHLTRYFFTA
jgi:phosphatidate cytidylyltransferase